MRKAKSTKSKQNFENQVRGILSKTKSSRYTEGNKFSPKHYFHRELGKVFLNARLHLNANDSKAFLCWTTKLVAATTAKLDIPTDFAAIGTIQRNAKTTDLQSELTWINLRINESASLIVLHCTFAQEIQRLVLLGEYADAIKELISHDEKIGESLWSVQLRISLESLDGDMEAQKKYSSQIRRERRVGLLPFICYHTSVRNEKRISIQRYRIQVAQRVRENESLSKAKKSYLLYRLAGELPNDVNTISEILLVEQAHHIVDIYDTFANVLTHLCLSSNNAINEFLAVNKISQDLQLSDIKLSRIVNQSKWNSISHAGRRDKRLPALLLTGNFSLAQKRYRQLVREKRTSDTWIQIYGGLSDITDPSKNGSTSVEAGPLGSLISAALIECDSNKSLIPELQKKLANLSYLPVFHETSLIAGMFVLPIEDVNFDKIGLCSYMLGIEDSWPQAAPLYIRDKVIQNETTQVEFQVVRYLITTLASTIQLISSGKLSDALNFINKASVKHQSIAANPVVATLKMSILVHLDHRDLIIEHLSTLAADNSAALFCIQADEILSSLEWKDYASANSKIDICIAAYTAWRENEDDRLATLIRLNVRKFFDEQPFSSPSKWIHSDEFCGNSKEIFFLSHVCAPQFLEQLSIITKSNEILDERIRICEFLSGLSIPTSEKYRDEQFRISETIELAEGAQFIHSQRIHVDDSAFKRWAVKELKESHSRYVDLLTIEKTENRDSDSLFADSLNPESPIVEQFIAETETDLLLLDIVRQLRVSFLEHPRFGLDFHLSKRVRHQSFVGLVRGPVEQEHFVTTKSSTNGEYASNSYWLEKLGVIHSPDEEIIEILFKNFSRRYDELLLEAKDKKFQIKTKGKMSGLIELPLTDRLINMIKGVSIIEKNFESFLDFVIMIFWGATSPSLDQAKEYISSNLKNDIVKEFDKLKKSVKEISNIGTQKYSDFDLVIGRTSTKVQSELDIAAGWFRKVNLNDDKRPALTLLEAVNLSAVTANLMNVSFTPNIDIDISDSDGDVLVDSQVFSQLHDLVFVVLDNASKHSGHDQPRISLHIKFTQEHSILQVSALTQMKKTLTESSIFKLDEIRTKISNGNFEGKTTREGGSGLLKLAASISKDTSSSIRFGEEDMMFAVHLTYALEETTLGLTIIS